MRSKPAARFGVATTVARFGVMTAAARFGVMTAAAGFGLSFVLSSSALAGPKMLQSFNTTHPVLSLNTCITKAEQTLRAMGLKVAAKLDNLSRPDVWYGESDKTMTIILCYPLDNGNSAQFITTAANDGSGVDLAAFQKQLLLNFYGAPPSSP
jgi:Ni,Fe-hydrogenase I small subunit